MPLVNALFVGSASLFSMLDVVRPLDEPPAVDIAPGPLDGGMGTVGTLLIVAAVLVGGIAYFRRRRRL